MRSSLAVAFPIVIAVAPLACGGDDTSSSSTTGGSTTSTSSATTGAGGAGGSGGGTSSTGTSTTSTGTSTTTGAGGAGGGSGGSGGGADCAALPAGPLAPTLVTDVLDGSEDLAFDGNGHIAAKQGGQVVLVDANGQTTTLASLAGTVYGLRYRGDGTIVAALPQQGKVVQIATDGTVTDYATGLGGPNGLFPDFDGNVWVTEFGGNKVTRINPDKSKDTVASGAVASAANGVVLDPGKTKLYYTEYQEGRIRRLDLDQPGATPVELAVVAGAALDGLVLDACGNVYAVDQGNSRLYRVKLDATGSAVGAPELLVQFPTNVANAQFGSGAGFDPQTIYAAGVPGSVYAVAVGVAGATVPMAP